MSTPTRLAALQFGEQAIGGAAELARQARRGGRRGRRGGPAGSRFGPPSSRRLSSGVAVGGGAASVGVGASCCCWSIQPRTAGSCKRFRSCCTWGGGGFCVGVVWASADAAPMDTKNSSAKLHRSRAGALWSACVVIIETAIPQKTPLCEPAQGRCTGATFCATSSWIAKKPRARAQHHTGLGIEQRPVTRN